MLTRSSSRRLALALFLLGACSTEPRAGATVPSPPDPSPDRVAVPRGGEPEVLPEPREVRFTTSDGVTISATLSAAASPDAPAIVLVHQLGSTRAEWGAIERRLRAAPSLTTLAIDLRGHGASTSGSEGTALDWHSFDQAAWAATALDVRAAFAFLRSAESGVRPSRIGAIGASIGSTAVIAAAAEDAAIDPLVVLSPGRAYHGFDAITPAMRLEGRHVLTAVAREEQDGVDTANAIGRITTSQPILVDGSAHGVALLEAAPGLDVRIEEFVRSSLVAAGSAP